MTVSENFVSRRHILASRILGAIAVLFLLFDGGSHAANIAPVAAAFAKLGFPAQLAPIIGVIELACVLLFIYPETSVLGAILLTGYLGGAIATQVRVGGGAVPIIFPMVIGALLWGALVLRDTRVRALLPLVGAARETGRAPW